MSLRPNALAERALRPLLARAGITVDGSAPWDIRVNDPAFYLRVLTGAGVGLGESYVDGLWDCPAIDELVCRVMRSSRSSGAGRLPLAWLHQLHRALPGRHSVRRAFELRHYDIGNELYRVMLDSRMVYSCGYWAEAQTLDAAQEAKLELACRKLGLQRGMRVLDIGCGWGSFMKYAAERHGVECVGVTISAAQAELGRELCAGLPVEIRLMDYRELDGKYDRIVSIGMFEHVGRSNYRRFMEVVRACLARDGLFLLHTIGARSSHAADASDPWMERYIFPGGELPGAVQIARAADGLLVMEDWHNFGADYDRTLMAWHANCERGWPALGARYDERFRRMWRYYLLSCAGLFRARAAHLWQILYSRRGIEGGWRAVR